MKNAIKNIKTSEVKFEAKFYPRDKPFWLNIHKYADCLKAGIKFPPITVAYREGKYILIDGFHRLEAYKKLNFEFIEAEIQYGLTDRDIYALAVSKNVIHGASLGVKEKTQAILKLQKFKFTSDEISLICCVSKDNIQKLVVSRVTSVFNKGTQKVEEVVLKRPVKHLIDDDAIIKDNVDLAQEEYSGSSQLSLINEVISLLENNYVQESKKMIDKLEYLHEQLHQYLRVKSRRKNK